MSKTNKAQQLLPMIFGVLQGKALGTMAELGIADILYERPMDIVALAKATGTDNKALHRLLNLLKQLGLVSESANQEFSCTELGSLLRKGHDSSLHNYVLLTNSELVLQIAGGMHDSLVSGQSSFTKMFGTTFYDALQDRPEEARTFDGAMKEITVQDVPEILDGFDFSNFNSVVDLGGGQGMLLSAVLDKYPQINGILVELPKVCVAANDVLQKHISNDRCEILAGDFFKAVPENAEIYILKRVLSHLNDTDAITLLTSIRKTMNKDGRLLVIDPDPESLYGASFNLLMLLLMGGGVRGEEELKLLFTESGFNFTKNVRLETELCIVEAIAT